MPVFAVFYSYDDRLDPRMQARPEHRAYLQQLQEQGALLEAGAYADDDDPGGLLIFRGDSATEIDRYIDADPYSRAGVISRRVIRTWGPIIGPWTSAAG